MKTQKTEDEGGLQHLLLTPLPYRWHLPDTKAMREVLEEINARANELRQNARVCERKVWEKKKSRDMVAKAEGLDFAYDLIRERM